MNFILVLVFAVIFTTIAGMLIGLPTLRLRGDYIAIVTLAFGEIIGRIAINGDALKIAGQPLTAGRQGITPVDKIDLPFLEPFTSLELRPWYYVALALVAIALGVSFALRSSRLGRAWIALREDEVAAVAMGVPGRQDEAAGLRHGRRVRRHGRRVPRVVQQHGERGPVPVLLLDPDPRHGDPRRPRLHLGRGPRRDRADDDQLLPDPGRVQLDPEQARARLRHDADHVRDLRLPARDHDDHPARRA